jgi:hypothetical protein
MLPSEDKYRVSLSHMDTAANRFGLWRLSPVVRCHHKLLFLLPLHPLHSLFLLLVNLVGTNPSTFGKIDS